MNIKHLVISGGGPSLLQYLSAIQNLHKNNIININKIESIYGTSAGCVMGVLLCLLFDDWEIINDYMINRPWHELFHMKINYIFDAYKNRGIYGKKIVPARIPAPAPVVTDPVPIDPSIYLNPFVSQTPNVNPTIPTQYINGSQLKTLYNVPNVSASTGIKKATIAIIVAYTYANLRSDLNNYWTNYTNFGPNSTPPVINVYTMPGATFNSGWALEECLDVQMVCTINPNATICVVEA
jgi:hypothetical protein